MQDLIQESEAKNDARETSVPGSTYAHNLGLVSGKAGHQLLTQVARGIEKEGLRVDLKGNFAMTAHPRVLGSALANPWLTTDFSESLLEFITPVFTSIEENLKYLNDIHAITVQHLNKEKIWAASMPCYLPEDDQIPVAEYGTSNIAKMKTIYRIGLGHRYGRAMQTVAGIHYNFSLPDNYWDIAFNDAIANNSTEHKNQQEYKSQRYLDLIRNFRRNYWLLIYLFGSAPCFDKSFVRGRDHNMQNLGQEDLYLPYATSLRMGNMGYQSVAQESLFICYNELDTYINTLGEAIHVPYKDYEGIGIIKDGSYQQLNTSLLQIENEFYSPIRPKRVTNSGETPLGALSERGVEYVEVRCLDINPFMPLGIDAGTIRFLDTFLLYCLLKENSLCNEDEFKRIAENQSRIVNHGRDPDLQVYCDKTEVPMRSCAHGLLRDMKSVAEQLDIAHATNEYSEGIQYQIQKIEDVNLTPSARILRSMSDHDQSHISFTEKQTALFASEFAAHKLDPDVERGLLASAEESLVKQKKIEEESSGNFEEFLEAYYKQ
jgi:glutamate--cysteine ligase